MWCKKGISGHLFKFSLQKLKPDNYTITNHTLITPYHRQITLNLNVYGFLMVVMVYNVDTLRPITYKSHFLPRGIL